MTYPGTKPRTKTALESSLISQVVELERERDELVEALRDHAYQNAAVREILAKYPRRRSAKDRE